jgi:hypothetical protein
LNEEDRYSVRYRWNRTEGDVAGKVEQVSVHETLNSLIESLTKQRDLGFDKKSARRKGLLIGDLRTADHREHGDLIEKAKLAVGLKGDFIVITPTKKTILNTTDKTDCWDDQNRLYHLRRNLNIDHLLMLDMPEEYWSKPGVFWDIVYRQVSPDLVFLGEANHPLRSQFEARCRYFGGLLLVDSKPITIRSRDLLEAS